MGISIEFRPIMPRRVFDERKIVDACKRGLEEAGKVIKADFEQTVRTWSPGGTDGKSPGGIPKFEIGPVRDTGGDLVLLTSTRHVVYYYLNNGVRPHPIKVRRAKALAFRTDGQGSYRAKTKARTLSSFAGGPTGKMTFRPRVQHPGSQAREFDLAIVDKRVDAILKAVRIEIETARL